MSEQVGETVTCAALRARELYSLSINDPYRERTPQETVTDCGACDDTVTVYSNGIVDTSACPVSGSCERSMIGLHPESYVSDEEVAVGTSKEFPCGRCHSIVGIIACADSKPLVEVTEGDCRLDESAIEYWLYGESRLNSAPLEDGTSFDGAGSPRDITETLGDPDEGPDFLELRGCIGNLLTKYANEGFILPPGEFQCPRSNQAGEHCMTTITVDEHHNPGVITDNIFEPWEQYCLFLRDDDV